MRRLNPTSRRWICRSLILVLGVAPLVSSVTLAAWYQWGDAAARLELQLTALLGQDLRIEDVSHPLPGVVHCQRAYLVHPESGEAFATAQQGRISSRDERLNIHFAALRIPAERLTTIWQLLHDRLLCQTRALGLPLQLTADRATIVTPQGELECCQLRMEASRHQRGADCDIVFRWLHDPDATPSISIMRRTVDVPITKVRCETGGRPLPCQRVRCSRRDLGLRRLRSRAMRCWKPPVLAGPATWRDT